MRKNKDRDVQGDNHRHVSSGQAIAKKRLLVVTTDPDCMDADRRDRKGLHGCPVLVEARRTVQLGRVLLRTLHRLQRSSRACERCEFSGDGLCPALERLQAQIHTTIEGIFEEWSS